MFETPLGLIFSSTPDVLAFGIYRAVCAWNQNAANSEARPYDWRNRSDDPVYKKNLQRLIERNREFEDARK